VHRKITIDLKGVVFMGFDRAGTSFGMDAAITDVQNGVVRETYWSLEDIPEHERAEKSAAEQLAIVKRSVRKSSWFGGYRASVKANVVSHAQGGGVRRVVCIGITGGPITEAEVRAGFAYCQDRFSLRVRSAQHPSQCDRRTRAWHLQ